jgi:hypothetical protein
MKKDMGGAALMLALGHAVMSLRLPVALRVLVPAVENSVSGDAYRPLDVLATRSGMTVEQVGGGGWRGAQQLRCGPKRPGGCSGQAAAPALGRPCRFGGACPPSDGPPSPHACLPRGPPSQKGNCDAEGRLILADALFEAATARPDLIVDAATLTASPRDKRSFAFCLRGLSDWSASRRMDLVVGTC